MRKRIIALLCVLALITSLFAGCGSKKKTINGIEAEAFPYHTDTAHSLFLVMTNKTKGDCDLEVSVTFKDKDGKTVDTVDANVTYAFATDTTIAEQYYCETEYDSYDYNITVKPLSYHKAIDKELTVSVTNNSKETAEFVEYYVLFFQGDKLVGYKWGYCQDEQNQIQPGSTATRNDHMYQAYDKADIYIHGRQK